MISNKGLYGDENARYPTKQNQKRMKKFENRDNIYNEVDLNYFGEMNIIRAFCSKKLQQKNKVRVNLQATSEKGK